MNETEQTTEVEKVATQPDGAEVKQSTVTRSVKTPGVILAQRIIWFIVGLINILLVTRFTLLALGANPSAGFVDFIYGITNVLVAPFVGIFGEPVYGRFMFDWSSIVAIIVYSLIALGIVKLLTLSNPEDKI
ncbi:MAG: YggT family protein [Patescibacteria group bacterium]